ncbi:hypothetical protein [Polaromonas sp. JS666]|uniref:hypothetical protein n=1 Tax=Polaromonas sp. (strain JS666 / ATCC BAA-500) TaxID=296591 RepID=UPI000053323C|nr:hypothetical protein [Polaromonas sp. JS666]ABE46946.1 hypothetical protein Bpro_5075 [Polaromonas sp. JS666]
MLRVSVTASVCLLLFAAQQASAQTSAGNRLSHPPSPTPAVTPEMLARVADFQSSEEVYPREAALLGQGWYRGMGRKMQAKCVYGLSKPVTGAASYVRFYDTYDRETMQRILNVSMKGSYGAASGSAKFSRETSFDKSKRNILAVATVDKGGEQLVALGSDAGDIQATTVVEFTPRAWKLLSDQTKTPSQRVTNFQYECGDSFVSTIRTGGKLSVMFTAEQSLESLKESFSAQASGGAGAFSASGSVSGELKKSLEQKSTKNISMQEGGFLNVALDADAVLKKIMEFPTFAKDLSVPYTLILVPYQSLPTWPKDLLAVGMSDWDLDIYTGHAQRLRELAQLYADAAVQPTRYYFPFLPDTNKDAARWGSALYAASTCTEDFVLQCARDAACDRDTLTDVAKLKAYCPKSFAPLEPNEVSKTLALMLPAAAIQKAASASGTGAELQTLRQPSANAALPTASSIFGMYYQLLALAPMRRLAKDDVNDEAHQVKILCDTLLQNVGVNCALVARAAMADKKDGADKAVRDRAYRQWVVSRRLWPLAATFCKETAQHPMCVNPITLEQWVGALSVESGPERNFAKDPSTAVVVNPERTKYIPSDPCERHYRSWCSATR